MRNVTTWVETWSVDEEPELLNSSPGSDLDWIGLRRLALRKNRSHEKLLVDALDNSHPLMRAYASLGMAYLAGEAISETVLRAANEAADPIERSMHVCAAIVAAPGRAEEYVDFIRTSLAEGPGLPEYWPEMRVDILDALETSGHPELKALAQAWSPFVEPRRGFRWPF